MNYLKDIISDKRFSLVESSIESQPKGEISFY